MISHRVNVMMFPVSHTSHGNSNISNRVRIVSHRINVMMFPVSHTSNSTKVTTTSKISKNSTPSKEGSQKTLINSNTLYQPWIIVISQNYIINQVNLVIRDVIIESNIHACFMLKNDLQLINKLIYYILQQLF